MSSNKPESIHVDGSGFAVGIIAARYNFHLVNGLLESVLQTLDKAGVRQENIETFRVPGANEIPYVAGMLGQLTDFDVLIALGVVIRGDTEHHAIIGHSTSQALHRVTQVYDIPIINGIITVNTEQQAIERCTGDLDRGVEFAQAALEVAQLAALLNQRMLEQGAAEMADMDMDDLDWNDDLEDDEPYPFR